MLCGENSKILKVVFCDVTLENSLEAGKCSVQIDITQDIAVQDQLAIVLRYVKSGIVREHLNRRIFSCCESLRHAEERTGNRQMMEDGLSFADVIGNSFD